MTRSNTATRATTAAPTQAGRDAVYDALVRYAPKRPDLSNSAAHEQAAAACRELALGDVVAIVARLRREHHIRGTVLALARTLVRKLDTTGEPVWEDGQAARGEALCTLATLAPNARATALEALWKRLGLTELHVRLLQARSQSENEWLRPLVARLPELAIEVAVTAASIDGGLATAIDLHLGDELGARLWLTTLHCADADPEVSPASVRRAELTFLPGGHLFAISPTDAAGLVRWTRAECAARAD